jgi:hypothetical protein
MALKSTPGGQADKPSQQQDTGMELSWNKKQEIVEYQANITFNKHNKLAELIEKHKDDNDTIKIANYEFNMPDKNTMWVKELKTGKKFHFSRTSRSLAMYLDPDYESTMAYIVPPSEPNGKYIAKNQGFLNSKLDEYTKAIIKKEGQERAETEIGQADELLEGL